VTRLTRTLPCPRRASRPATRLAPPPLPPCPDPILPPKQVAFSFVPRTVNPMP
jgi:hypothetical protein